MQFDTPHDEGSAPRPASETAGQVAAAPPTHASQLDSPALTSTTTSDRHADHSSTATQPRGGADSLQQPGEATEGAEEGDVGPAEEGTPATTARPLAAPVAVDLEQASINLNAPRDVTPDALPIAVPFQSVFAIPRPASLTSRITEPTSNAASGTNGERDSTAEEDNALMRAHIEQQLGVSTTTEQDHAHAHVLEQPSNGNSLLVLASATRSVSAPASGDDNDPQGAGEEQQRQQRESRKRPRSAESGGDDDDGRETDQGSPVEPTFDPFPPGWHLEGATTNVQGGDEAGASPSDTPKEGGDEDLAPASRRRRTEEPGPVGGETPNTMQQLDEAHDKWHQHREATLRSLQAQAMARSAAARHPPAASSSAGPSLPPSYQSYSSIASDAPAYPYGGGPTPLLPPQAMMGGGGTSTFSGRAGATATTSSQWYEKGNAYYVAHEQQRGQPGMQGYPTLPPAAAADMVSQIEGVAPRQARSIYDSPRPLLPHASYYYGGVPGYVYQSTPQQQRQRYPSPFPGPPLPQSGGYDASSPSTPAAASSILSNVSDSKGEWSDPSSSSAANTTASTSVNNTSSSSSSLLSRSAEAAEGQRNAIPIRAQSNLASLMHSAPAPSASYSQGSEAPTPEPSSSVLVGTEQGQAESQDPTSALASGSGGGGTASSTTTTSASSARKPSGRRPAPANAYSINQIQGVKPFIYKLRWLLQNPQEVGNVITWSNDGSAVLVKIGVGNDAMLKQMLMRTFSHENPGAFTRQFAVYGFTQIKDPEELAEVLDPTTQPADAWRAYEDESGTFHRDGLDDLDALKTMVAKKKGAGGSTTTTTTTTTTTATTGAGRMMPAVQQRGQASGAGIPVQAEGIGEGTTVLLSIPGGAIATATTTTTPAVGTSFPTLQQGYWPSTTTSQSGHPHASSSSSSSSSYPQAGQQQQYYQQQQHPSPSSSASASEYVHIAPKSVGQAGQVLDDGREGGSSRSRSRSKTQISLGGWFRQAADIPRMGGIEGLLRGPGAGATSTVVGAADDHQDDGAVGHVSGPTVEEEEGEEGSTAAEA